MSVIVKKPADNFFVVDKSFAVDLGENRPKGLKLTKETQFIVVLEKSKGINMALRTRLKSIKEAETVARMMLSLAPQFRKAFVGKLVGVNKEGQNVYKDKFLLRRKAKA